MAPSDVLAKHTSRELEEWRAYFTAENKRANERASQREQQARLRKGRR